MTLFDTNVLGADYSAPTAPLSTPEAHEALEPRQLAGSDSESPEALKSPWGIMFDLGWDFKEPVAYALTKRILKQIAPDAVRTGKWAVSQNTRIRKIVANGLYAFFFLRPPFVAYYRKGDADCYRSKIKPAWFNGKAMRNTIDALENAGLLESMKGEQGKGASTYKITQKLLILSMEAGITEHDLDHELWLDRLLRVYETNRKGGKLVDLPLTSEAELWQSHLADFNRFTGEHKIALDVTDGERELVLERVNKRRKKGLPSFYRPALMKTGLYRSFNYASFAKGGRLYGGWWQGVPGKLRCKMVIDEQPTVELDYSCFHVRMLYNLLGLAYEGEAYFLEQIAELERELGLPEDYYREAIKKITQALINSPKGVKGERCKLPDGVSFHPYFTRAEVRAMIEEKHQLIAEFFSSGKGLELQRLDSDLALQIITNLRKKGILALPIHDSFIVQQKHERELWNEMNLCYKSKFIYDPMIDKKSCS